MVPGLHLHVWCMQVGDVVKLCSAVVGEDMWQATDIRRVRGAINNRTSKVTGRGKAGRRG